MSRPQSQASERAHSSQNKSRSKVDLSRSTNSISKPVIIPTNSKGGVLVTKEELRLAFQYFDKRKKQAITKSDLKDAFAKPGMSKLTNKELRTIFPEDTMDYNTLEQLLIENEITEFDPVKEACKVFHLS